MILQRVQWRGSDASGLPVICVVGRYPLVTTTFIDREIRDLRRRGLGVDIVAMRRPPPDMPRSEVQRELERDVTYLIPIAWPKLVAAHLRFALRQPREYFGTLLWLVTRRHPSVRARMMTVLHFGEGVFVAHLVRDRAPRELYAHFADRAAIVALVASRLLHRPYSLSIHAGADVFVRPVLLPEKVEHARCVVTCTASTRDQITTLVGNELGQKVRYIRHGLELGQYRPAARSQSPVPTVVAVGQLREKKGFPHLIAACAVLRDRGYDFRCRIVGEGPQREELRAQIAAAGLDDVVRLCGALPHEEVIAHYAQAQMFVLPCVVTPDGQVDGIPNVVPEAMAMQLPVICSDLAAIRELVTSGVDGILVPAGDVTTLADAMAGLLDDPEWREALGRRGRQTVLEQFDVEVNVRRLVEELWPDRIAVDANPAIEVAG